MLRVRLREHHELDVGRVAALPAEVLPEIRDLVVGERETELPVRALDGGHAFGEQRHALHRPRWMVFEQRGGILDCRQHSLGHPIVQQRQKRRMIVRAKRIAVTIGNPIDDAALDARHGIEAAIARDVGRLRRPRRDGAGPRHDEHRHSGLRCRLVVRTVGEEPVEHAALGRRQRAVNEDEMPVQRGDAEDAVLRAGAGECCEELGYAERRQRVTSAQRKYLRHAGWGA